MAKSNAKGKTPVRHNNGTSKSKGRLAEKGTPPPALQPDRPPLSHPPPPPPTFPLPEVVEEVRAELAAKAQELYQKMDPLIPRPLRERDSVSIGAEGLAIGDEQYWASVPQHIRNAVMKYYSSPPSRQQNGLDMKEVELHSLAQKLVDGGFVDEHGVGPNIGLPFDPSMLENSAFDQYIKDAAATLVPIPPMDFRVDVTLEEHEIVEDDEYYSEDEQGPEMQVPLSKKRRNDPYNLSSNSLERTNTFSKTKPSKRKKSKATVTSTVVTSVHTTKMVTAPLPERSPESRPTPQSADRRRDKSSLPPSVSSTTTTTANMPAPKSQQQPPPSSVSMGKKPMLYPPASQTPATTTTAQQQSQGKSARAASKQPLSAHAYPHNHPHHHPSSPSSNASQPQKPRPPNSNNTSSKNNKIWSTSNSEERERIKEFWLGLGEEERRNLVKIEKDTVLRKMKEQQKHSCNCAVCGRKRTAIEEELEVLYDAYYEELEQYANYQQRYVSSGRTIPPPPGPGPFPGSVEVDKDGAVVGPNSKSPHPPPRNTAKHPNGVNGRKAQLPSVKQAESEFDDDEGDDYDDEEEEYDEEEEEGEEEEEEEEEEVPEEEEEKPPRSGRQGREVPASRGRRPGNILTVADDLLKNDGQKFLEMMEQLAERRMQREEEAAVNVEEDSEDEEEDEEEEDDDEEDEEEDDEEDDEEVMTEEQKMEEGKRMFSIFAARMFEQRVLQAYREKVAQERQLQLLRELEDEDKQTKEKEAKKQSQNQKKKDKKKQQKMAKEEERALKAAEKAAEEAALKAKQFALEEEQRKRKEEDRLKREADRKVREEEKQRKDEERRRRLVEEKEREAEREKKRKEKEEKARREKEEKERKAREEREAKAAQEKAAAAAKRDQMEKEKKEKEEKERKEREEKAEREAKERLAQQQQQSQQRAASSSKAARAPPSPRNTTASGSSNGQRAPVVNGIANKKILSKPPAVSTPAAGPSQIQPSTSQRSQQSRPLVVHPSQPATPITPQLSQHHHLPPQPPMFPPGPPGIIPPASALSPRTPFAPPPFGFAPGPSMQPSPTSPLAPSAIPRNFGLGGPPPPFDSPFPRGIAPIVSVPSPIGPPPKTPLPPLAPPSSLAPGSNRRASVPDPGPITRPIAPIARPTEVSTSSSGSPVRRSPSPKGVLGSSALAAEDDEVVSAPTRRSGSVGTVGHGWGPASPRGAIGDNTIRPPWASGAPPGGPIMPPGPPGFGNPRPIGNLWGAPGNPDWHPTNGPFFSNTFLANTASPPPHSNS